MKFQNFKIAILAFVLYIIPCISGMIFIVDSVQKTVLVYDVQTNTESEIGINEYIIGVVAAEMPANFEPEALKAQAVAARTYLVQKGECSNHSGCSICTDPAHCQAYKSDAQLKEQWGSSFYKYYSKISKAVAQTSDEIIVYENEPISAVFHSTSSGRTENAEDVWSSPVPYLKSTDSSDDVKSPKFSSEKTLSLEEFKNTIISAAADVDFESEIVGETALTKGGSVATVSIGGKVFEGTEIRSMFGLNSACFDIDISGDDVIFTVAGYGHGVGMSQYGANFMAQSGFDYTDIIKKYYTGVEIITTDYAYNYD